MYECERGRFWFSVYGPGWGHCRDFSDLGVISPQAEKKQPSVLEQQGLDLTVKRGRV